MTRPHAIVRPALAQCAFRFRPVNRSQAMVAPVGSVGLNPGRV